MDGSHDQLTLNAPAVSCSSGSDTIYQPTASETSGIATSNFVSDKVNTTSTVAAHVMTELQNSDSESQDSLSQERSHSFLRKELLALLPHDENVETTPGSVTPDTDAISLATTTSCDGDREPLCPFQSPHKHKQGRRTKKWLNDSDKEPLSYELEIGARILGDFMVEANKALTWPFLNKVDALRDGVPDYYDIIRHPVWFNLSKAVTSLLPFSIRFYIV